MTQPRSSLAVALQDYKGPRPGIALTIAAVALIAAIFVGAIHVYMLSQSSASLERSQQAVRSLHRYDATLEVWRQMAGDGALEFDAQRRLRDSIALQLSRDMRGMFEATVDPIDAQLLTQIIRDLDPGETADPAMDLNTAGREAMILLRGRHDSVLFQAATDSRRSQIFGAVFIALTVLAAGVMIIPMSWLYVRYKRGVPPGM